MSAATIFMIILLSCTVLFFGGWFLWSAAEHRGVMKTHERYRKFYESIGRKPPDMN